MPETVQRRFGAIALGDLVGRLGILRVTCSKCDRSGQYPVALLIERHGPALGLPDFKEAISADCSLRAKPGAWEPCGAGFPDLHDALYGG